MGEMFATSPSVFHFRIRTSFQVPGFEWVHELLLLCLTSNSAQFCAEIACGKTGLGHNCTDSTDSGVGRENTESVQFEVVLAVLANRNRLGHDAYSYMTHSSLFQAGSSVQNRQKNGATQSRRMILYHLPIPPFYYLALGIRTRPVGRRRTF